MSIKNPLTPAGIEPATFRFVAQHLNHCVTAVPTSSTVSSIIPPVISKYSSVVWGDFQCARYRPHFQTTLINKTGIINFF